MKLKKILFAILLFPSIAFAGWTELSCISPNDGFTIVVEFDDKKGLVRYMGGPIVNAQISSSQIIFTTLPPDSYLHIINRSTGVMMIRNEQNNAWITPHQCSIARRKF